MLRRVEEGPEINVEDNLGMNVMSNSGCIMRANFTPRDIQQQFYILSSTHLSFSTKFPPGLRIVSSYQESLGRKKFLSARKEGIRLAQTMFKFQLLHKNLHSWPRVSLSSKPQYTSGKPRNVQLVFVFVSIIQLHLNYCMQIKTRNHISYSPLYLLPEDFSRALIIIGAISICTELIKWIKSATERPPNAVNDPLPHPVVYPFCLLPFLSFPILMSSPHSHHPGSQIMSSFSFISSFPFLFLLLAQSHQWNITQPTVGQCGC